MKRTSRSNGAWIGGALLGAAIVAHAGAGHAHARLETPPSRDFGQAGADSHKDPNGPCGKIAPTTKTTVYKAGSTIEVKWTETVDHPGCFLVGLSTMKDPTAQTDFTVLANIKHTTQGATPRPYTAMVQLPAGVTCAQCTLQVRQLMLANDNTACPPATIANGATYYTCADVTLEAPVPPDMGAPADMSTPADLSTPDMAMVPAEATGCQVAGAAAGAPWGVLGLGAAALVGVLVRRRRA